MSDKKAQTKAELEEKDVSLQQQENMRIWLLSQLQTPEILAELELVENSMMSGLDEVEGIRPQTRPRGRKA